MKKKDRKNVHTPKLEQKLLKPDKPSGQLWKKLRQLFDCLADIWLTKDKRPSQRWLLDAEKFESKDGNGLEESIDTMEKKNAGIERAIFRSGEEEVLTQ